MKTPLINSIFLETIETYHVIEIACKLKPKISSGQDEISTKLLKETIEYIKYPLTHIINRSLLMGIVPNQMKIGEVIPIKPVIPLIKKITDLSVFSRLFPKYLKG